MLVIGGAVFFDSIQIIAQFFHPIPVLGTVVALMLSWVVTSIAFLTFTFVFLALRIKFIQRKPGKMLAFGGSFVAEMVPLIQALPTWTISVLIVFWLESREEKACRKKQREAAEAQKAQLASVAKARNARYNEVAANDNRSSLEEAA